MGKKMKGRRVRVMAFAPTRCLCSARLVVGTPIGVLRLPFAVCRLPFAVLVQVSAFTLDVRGLGLRVQDDIWG